MLSLSTKICVARNDLMMSNKNAKVIFLGLKLFSFKIMSNFYQVNSFYPDGTRINDITQLEWEGVLKVGNWQGDPCKVPLD